MSPDREHLHHIMQRAGLSQTGTTWFAIALTTLTGLVGIATWQLGIVSHWLFASFLLLVALNMPPSATHGASYGLGQSRQRVPQRPARGALSKPATGRTAVRHVRRRSARA